MLAEDEVEGVQDEMITFLSTLPTICVIPIRTLVFE